MTAIRCFALLMAMTISALAVLPSEATAHSPRLAATAAPMSPRMEIPLRLTNIPTGARFPQPPTACKGHPWEMTCIRRRMAPDPGDCRTTMAWVEMRQGATPMANRRMAQMRSISFLSIAATLVLAWCSGTWAQDLGTMAPKPLPALAHPDDPNTPAKDLFGRKTTPAAMQARSIGYYTHGCLAGGVALPINGPTWQVMRLSRNRNWGHPELVKTLERLANKAPSIGWSGFLVGDMAQPRGGPMITGHWSHQVGLDADVWLTPMPDHELSQEERENMMATNVVRDDWQDVRPDVWGPKYVALYKMLAE